MNIWKWLFPAKPVEQFNDLEQALLDDLRDNPGDWDLSQPKSERGAWGPIFCLNRKRGVSTHATLVFAQEAWEELGDAVRQKFRGLFCSNVRALWLQRKDAAKTAQQQADANKLRAIYELD